MADILEGRPGHQTGPRRRVPVRDLPEIYNALEIRTQSENGGPEVNLVAQVEQHIGRNQVRAVAMSSTDGVVRGMPVRDRAARSPSRSGRPRSGGS